MTEIFISAGTMVFPYNFLIVASKYGEFIVDVDVSEVFFLGYSQQIFENVKGNFAKFLAWSFFRSL